jgi:UDP-N-acetyl-D-mannosaminuronic acid transferase (WecB/TagA/CpsF family)
MEAQQSEQHRDILGIRVAALEWRDALRKVEEAVNGGGPQRIFHFLNANNANLAMRNQTYRQGLSRSEVLPDGVGVDLASRTLCRAAFPANLNGTDFVPALLVHIERPLTIALIGARPEILEQAVANLQAATPWHRYHAVADGYFERSQQRRRARQACRARSRHHPCRAGQPCPGTLDRWAHPPRSWPGCLQRWRAVRFRFRARLRVRRNPSGLCAWNGSGG